MFHITLNNPLCTYYPFRGYWRFGPDLVKCLPFGKKGNFWSFIKWYVRKRIKRRNSIKHNLCALIDSKIPFVKKGIICEFRNPNEPQVDFYLAQGKWRNEGSHSFIHRKGVENFLVWYRDPLYKDTSTVYKRAEIYSVPLFKAFYHNQHGIVKIGNYSVRCSKRYKVFCRNTKCVACGMEGKYFALERLKEQISWHFNLYGINSHGHEILMTVDHIVPLSKGGGNAIKNLQTMCRPCNHKKGNKYE